MDPSPTPNDAELLDAARTDERPFATFCARYLGAEAVAQRIVGAQFLGERVSGPGRG